MSVRNSLNLRCWGKQLLKA